MNQHISKLFRELAEYRKEEGERYSAEALFRAADVIDDIDYEINKKTLNKFKSKKIPGIAKKSIDRVTEIVNTGDLLELKELRSSEKTSTESDEEELSDLRIVGFGSKSKQKIINQGYKTIAELKEAMKNKEIKLTYLQQFGVKYYEDLTKRIPRTEIERICDYIKKVANEIDNNIKITIVGSYRRKSPDSGDIDILMTHPKDINYLSQLIDELKDRGLLRYVLSFKEVKFMGAYYSNFLTKDKSSPKIMRKIDIRFCPIKSYPTGLMHSTGSKDFNLKMRRKAMMLGYKLSEYSITDRETGEIIEVESEKQIFNLLDHDYIKPEDRK